MGALAERSTINLDQSCFALFDGIQDVLDAMLVDGMGGRIIVSEEVVRLMGIGGEDFHSVVMIL